MVHLKYATITFILCKIFNNVGKCLRFILYFKNRLSNVYKRSCLIKNTMYVHKAKRLQGNTAIS
jgi:hypothetical protein